MIGIVRRHLTWHPASWLSVLVRFFTGCRYNHAFILYEINYVPCVIEATIEGVIITPLEEWKQKYPHEVKLIELKDYTFDAGKLISSLGKDYDFASLIRYQFKHQIQRWFGIKKWTGKTGEIAANKLYCSELVAYCYNVPEWWRFTTADLLELNHEIL
jgi:hypothetical protein